MKSDYVSDPCSYCIHARLTRPNSDGREYWYCTCHMDDFPDVEWNPDSDDENPTLCSSFDENPDNPIPPSPNGSSDDPYEDEKDDDDEWYKNNVDPDDDPDNWGGESIFDGD